MTYDIQWAVNFSGFSKSQPMDLRSFAKFFDEHLANRNYVYETDNIRIPKFTIRVELSQLPHLMGLQKWANLNYSQPNKQVAQMLNGDLNIELLKKSDKSSWNQFYRRIEGLPILYKMLFQYKCEIKIVNQVIKSGYTRRNIQMIFVDKFDKYDYVLELREAEPNTYVLTSFTFSPTGKSSDLKVYHHPIKIKSLTIERIMEPSFQPKFSNASKQSYSKKEEGTLTKAVELTAATEAK